MPVLRRTVEPGDSHRIVQKHSMREMVQQARETLELSCGASCRSLKGVCIMGYKRVVEDLRAIPEMMMCRFLKSSGKLLCQVVSLE